MTIGIDASRANRVEKTGIEWYAYHLLNAMKKITDHTDRFLLYTDTALTGELKELPKSWKETLLGWWPGKFWTQGRLSLEMLLRAPDLLFIPSHVIPVVHPNRVILTCHDVGFERRPELYPSAERAYHRWSMRYGVRAATHIIAVSEFTKRELMDVYGLPSEKITVIHHGFYGGTAQKISNFQFPISNKIPNPNPPAGGPNSPYFLYVGRIEAKKNLDVIIDAFSLLKKERRIPEAMRLLLVGRSGYQHELVLCRAEGVYGGETIEYHPWVPSERLQELYRSATAFLFPSLYEGFGFPVLEALSYGVPVIASDIPALREIGGSAPTFVSPTVDGFREAMAAVASHIPTEGERAQWKAHTTQFSWEYAAKKTLTVLKNAL